MFFQRGEVTFFLMGGGGLAKWPSEKNSNMFPFLWTALCFYGGLVPASEIHIAGIGKDQKEKR